MSDQKAYAPPPNMQVPNDNKKTGYPQAPGYPQQSEFAPYGYASNSLPPTNLHVPNNVDTDPIVKGFEFSTETIRRGFIRKVYSILTVQLLVTLGVVMSFTYHPGTKEYAIQNFWLFPVSFIFAIVTIITLSCCEGVRRTSPHNMIFLALFTVAESLLVGYCALNYDENLVMIAVLMTAVVVVALTIFAFQTKWDFTMMGGILFVALMLMIVLSLIFMLVPRSPVIELIFSSFGALLFCAYLIHDTQLIMGGNHKYSLSPEEYVMGAITLFLDIINIFLYILRILGASTKN